MGRPHAALAVVLALCFTLGSAQGRRLGEKAAARGPPPRPPQQLARLPDHLLPADEGQNQKTAQVQGQSQNGSGQAGSGLVEMKIIQGEVADAFNFRFMVALLDNQRFFCGGTVLDATTVLTAAHCVVDTRLVDNPGALSVWRVDGTQHAVDRVFPHPGYDPNKIPQDNEDLTFEGELHDIAVLKLAVPLPDPVEAVPLADDSTQLQAGARLEVAGWGTTEIGQTSDVLMYGRVAYLPTNLCPGDYADVVCAGGTGENTCNGDSGGPLLLRDPSTNAAVQVGVTSHGPDCLSAPSSAQYGFYTDVRRYLGALEAFLNSTQTSWPTGEGEEEEEGSGELTAGGGDGSGLDFGGINGAVNGGSGDGSDWGWVEGGASSTNEPGGGLGPLEQIFCQVFGCS